MLSALSNAFDPLLLWEYRQPLLEGLAQNVIIFAEAFVLSIILAFLIGNAGTSRNTAIRWLATCYTEFFRNTPEYVLLVWIYFVLPLIVGKLVGGRANLSPTIAAVLGLGLAYSGFLAETVRAGLRSVPRGHSEAAMALGMTPFRTFYRIVLPQAVRRMLPEIINQMISLFKSTTIVSLITVQDIMYQVSVISTAEMRPVPLYTGAAVLYCIIIIIATQALHRLTSRWRQRGWA
jgi:polar amino acid transport system permease protein